MAAEGRKFQLRSTRIAGSSVAHVGGSRLGALTAYVKTRLTNGIVEGFNNKLRMIARRAFGFHSPDPLILMLYLTCGGIALDPPLPQNHPPEL